jgi:ABC-type nitrate/sulfonate/bicarbonate transport system ATPase subunit
VGALSEGERQRVLLAGEVARLEQSSARLRVLLLDEPFGALDPAAHLRLMEALLGWLCDSRNAAVLVSHSPLVDLGLARAAGVPAKEWTIDGGQP